MSDWNDCIMLMLDKIRINSLAMSEKHRKRFLEYSGTVKYFDVPIILCSIFSSSFSSLNSVPTSQSQMITTSISMFIAVITSIKLYLNLASNINQEISLSKDFYILSISIFKTINLKETDRGVEAVQFLNECYSQYIKLIEQSSLLRKHIRHDELTKIEMTNKKYDNISDCSNSSIGSESPTRNIIITPRDDI